MGGQKGGTGSRASSVADSRRRWSIGGGFLYEMEWRGETGENMWSTKSFDIRLTEHENPRSD